MTFSTNIDSPTKGTMWVVPGQTQKASVQIEKWEST